MKTPLFSFLKSSEALTLNEFKAISQDFVAALNLPAINEFNPSEEINQAQNREAVRRVLVKANLLKVCPARKAWILQPIENFGQSELNADVFVGSNFNGDKLLNLDALIAMLLRGIDPDMLDQGGTTAMMMGVDMGDLERLQILLASGADPNIIDDDIDEPGNAALTFAITYNRHECVRVLLAGGADPNIKTKNKLTALEYAISVGNIKCVQLLQANMGINVDIVDLWNAALNSNRPNILENHADHNIAYLATICPTGEEIEMQRVFELIYKFIDVKHIKDVFWERTVSLPEAWRRTKPTLVAKLFALIAFVSDGLLQKKNLPQESSEKEENAQRFIDIANRLPMEVQMLLCNHAFRSKNEVVLTKHSEPEFKALARRYTPG